MRIFKTVKNDSCHAERSRSIGILSFVLLFFFSLQTASAQQNDGCVDEFQKNQFFQCPAFGFIPVCACDGNTYFNECDAINHGGIVNNNYSAGVCGDAAMFLGQVPADRLLRMFFQFKQGGGNLTFMIVDIYGQVMRQQFIRSSNELPIILDIETSTFPPGIYIAYAFGGSFRKTIKFSAGTL